MVSRLDRLFILLDTGSNESIRLAAAKQLGEVQRVQPNERDYLLQRIKEYSTKTVWETRTAAGHATRCVLEHVGAWPPQSPKVETADNKASCRRELAEKVIEQNVNTEQILTQFDLEKIVSSCPRLLSLDTTEDDDLELVAPASSKGTTRGRGRGRKESKSSIRKSDKEQLLRQRKLINKELGIAMVDSLNLGVKSTDIVSNDDLQVDYESGYINSHTTEFTSNQLHAERSILQNSVSNYEKILETLIEANCIDVQKDDKSKDILETNLQWPLADITKHYTEDLFSPSWETRHGAAIALREIVRLQGKFAGRWTGFSSSANNFLNQLWLVDMALRALSVLALDRFGDFLFDQVVAPVRENAAQLLGCCLVHMSQPNTYATIRIILNMLKSTNWETRHGGILGLKYYLNVVDESSSKELLQECFDPITKCLADPVDDVSAEAAAALVPVIGQVINNVPDRTPDLIKFLWGHLADLDELTTSTSNIVLLLASLVTSSSTQIDSHELIKSIPRFWPLFSHSSTSVRISVLRALITLLKSQKSTCLSWMPENLMTTALRLVLQRAILENMEEVRPYIEEAWMLLIQINDESSDSPTERLHLLKSTSQYLNSWLCLIMQPSNVPIDRGSQMWLNIKPDGTKSDIKPEGEVYIGSSTFDAETMSQQKQQVTKCRLLGARLIGALYANLINDFGNTEESQYAKDTLKYVADTFNYYIKTKSANQRTISGWAVESWACYQSKLIRHDYEKLKSILPESLIETLNLAIQETSLCYDELASTFTRLQQEARSFVSALRKADININLPVNNDKRVIYTLHQIQSFCELDIESEITKLISKRTSKTSNPKSDIELNRYELFNDLNSKKVNLNKVHKLSISSQKSLSVSVLSSLACAHISWRCLPKKINLATQPLLDSIEFEEEQSLQDTSIKYLVTLINMLSQEPEQNNDLVKTILYRLIDMVCATPNQSPEQNGSPRDGNARNNPEVYKIILLDNLQRRAELSRVLSRRQSSINSTTSLKRSHSLTSSIDLEFESSALPEEQLLPQQVSDEVNETKFRGASAALSLFVKKLGPNLPVKAPFLWERITTNVRIQVDDHTKSDSSLDVTDLIKNLQILRIVGQSVDIALRKDLLDLFQDLIRLLKSSNPTVRHQSAQCIGIISKLMLGDTIELINTGIIAMLEQNDDIVARCGAIEAVALIIEHLQLDLAPRINMFIIHVLRRMGDQNDQIRLMATHCFGKLLVLMPLNLEKSKDVNGTAINDLKYFEKDQDQRFIEQLLDPKKLDNFTIPFKMEAQLRRYQQDGLNWLAFLNRFNLHGILCDEMGLGKTLMTICIVASDHFPSGSTNKGQGASVGPSLIVCPSTLTEHWLYEVNKFLPEDLRESLNPVAYSGVLSDRMSLRCHIMKATSSKDKDIYNKLSEHQSVKPVNLVVASFDIVRNDIEFFKNIQWNYCVLDEGHIIKNGKTKLSRAIRLLNAQHRLILSGTPIQNNVTELWSLFDFLMPGFLGSERHFNSRYARPILQSREMKCSTRELEAGALAMESLHRQVLPFTLRRLKEDVLDDLPPKIIQDYYCELSTLQQKLYEDFTRSKLCKDETKQSIQNLKKDDAEVVNSEVKSNAKSHVFQALQYLKNVCNHPKLVLTAKHTQYTEIKKILENQKSTLDDISHSSKLTALKQLLIDCGIGTSSQSGEEQQQSLTSFQSVVNQHRALVFCQLRSMVDIIENDLLKKHLPTVTYLKLDGSVPVNQRQSIVSRFNNDPSIDILLLTTQIGGLGLNLTGADTVIFVEHDWNPTKDLQAMDRAHRIGQKKVVNVYRLITKGTLEEKIMGLQKFKTMVSNTVINQDNSSLGTMKVDQLFDLFEDKIGDRSSNETGKQSDSIASGSGKLKSSAVLDLLPELWDQQQYETEYDLSSFVSSLKK